MDSQDIVRQLSDYRHNPGVRAILLRIDSPGGAVAPAQEIYREVEKLRDGNKIVFASLGTVAASGATNGNCKVALSFCRIPGQQGNYHFGKSGKKSCKIWIRFNIFCDIFIEPRPCSKLFDVMWVGEETYIED